MLFGHLPIGTGGVARSSLFVLSPQPHQEFQSTQNWDEVSGEAATPRGWDRLKFGSCLDGCEGGCLGGVQGRIGQAGRQVSGIWRGSRWGTRHLCVSENPPSINSECWIDWSGEARIPDYWIRSTRFLPKLTSARSNMRSERSTNQSQWHLWCRDAWGERGECLSRAARWRCQMMQKVSASCDCPAVTEGMTADILKSGPTGS